MKLNILETEDEMSAFGANLVLETVRKKPDAVLCMPTGNTPLGLYRELAEAQMPPDFWSRVRIVSLDEYWGIRPDDEKSLCGWLDNVLIRPLGIPDRSVYRFDLTLPTVDAVCREFEQRITGLGKIDLCVLGLGLNGHLGFNEPGTSFDSRTHCLKLKDETLAANTSYWGGEAKDIPAYGLTLGLGNIMESRDILLLVSGERKAAILKKLAHSPETPELPASCLRRAERATIAADRAAASFMIDG